jgi:S-adenosylmethionine decarboxylase
LVTLNALLISALAAVAIPLADRQRRSWISRLVAKLRRPTVNHSAPPLIDNAAGWDPQALELENSVGSAMKDAAIASEATVVTDSFHEFKPYGVSGAVIIQESHYTIHTWPEHKYAAVDLFYCGGTIYVDRAIEVLRERFKPGRMKFLVVRRGLQGDVEGK